jgi:hypothetical protein
LTMTHVFGRRIKSKATKRKHNPFTMRYSCHYDRYEGREQPPMPLVCFWWFDRFQLSLNQVVATASRIVWSESQGAVRFNETIAKPGDKSWRYIR